jgi:hypothetical protein
MMHVLPVTIITFYSICSGAKSGANQKLRDIPQLGALLLFFIIFLLFFHCYCAIRAEILANAASNAFIINLY